MVYLSSTAFPTGLAWLLEVPNIPFSPSAAKLSSFHPQSIAKASRPRTLMPRLLVLAKTVAITGNRSFLRVEKSKIGKTTGSVFRAASTIECVGDSKPRSRMGSIST